MAEGKSVGVLGAGVAGLACARALKLHGHSVVLFDKGRGPGGRLSTRRAETPLGEARFDHGAQYFTARGPDFLQEIEALSQSGFVAPWQGSFATITGDAVEPSREEVRWVGTPGMNDLVRGLAQGLDVTWGTRVAALRSHPRGQNLIDEAGNSLGHYDAIVTAIPAEQAGPFLRPHSPVLADAADKATTAPCWAGMFAFEAPPPSTFDGARFVEHDTLGWIARNSSKPGRDGGEAWVVHASPAWSQQHLEESANFVEAALLKALQNALGISATPLLASAHRWRFAQTTTAIGQPFLLNDSGTIGVCGDWLLGARIELAWQSGTALGHALAASLAPSVS